VGKLDGRVALISGIARGQGRAHAVKLAAEGADIIGFDIAGPVETVDYAPATPAELAETVAMVEELGRRIVAAEADARDHERLAELVDGGVAELGRLDVVITNAGIFGPPALSWEMDETAWRTTLDVNLTGSWQTTRVAIPHILAGGRGGSIILTSSICGLVGSPHASNYVAAKHGVLGLMKSLANELGASSVRVNAILPSNVRTGMLDNEVTAALFRPDLEDPSLEDGAATLQALHVLPVPWVESEDIANAALFLASDDARYVTGSELLVDAGLVHKYGAG
jgi:(+)-trans-carveol dehydrogenase